MKPLKNSVNKRRDWRHNVTDVVISLDNDSRSSLPLTVFNEILEVYDNESFKK